MKKWLRNTILLNQIIGLNSIAVSQTTKSSNSITISAPDWPPYYIDQTKEPGDLKGFGWEISNMCSIKLGLSPKFEQFPIRRMFKEMEKGTLELNIMSFKADREKAVSYGKEVVFSNSYGLWTRTGLQRIPKTFTDLDTLTLAELVGLRTSDAFREYLDRRHKMSGDSKIQTLSETDAIAKMLASSRVDAAVTSNAEMRYRLKKLGLTSKVSQAPLNVTTQDYFFVISKNSKILKTQPDIVVKFDQCVRQLKSNGIFEKLANKYSI